MGMQTLESIVQLQLATETTTVFHLPIVLESLTEEHFHAAPAPPLHSSVASAAGKTKWITRVNSLLHSKEPAGRWAGACLARRTAAVSKDVLVECASRWIAVVLPWFSKKNELGQVLRAGMALLVEVFEATARNAEFRRQVATPNVPKFAAALIVLAETGLDDGVMDMAFATLAHMVPLYPTLHRQLVSQVTAVCLANLQGSFPVPRPRERVALSAQLLAALHLTDGKVGAAAAWRKLVDDTVGSAWECLREMGGAKGTSNEPQSRFGFPPFPHDPVYALPLAASRLENMIVVLDALFRVNPSRPVPVPVNSLVNLAIDLMQPRDEGATKAIIDSTRATMEGTLSSYAHRAGCGLVKILANCIGLHLIPHIPQLLTPLVYHLEEDHLSAQNIPTLEALKNLLQVGPIHNTHLASRIFKVIAPLLSPLLPSKTSITGPPQPNGATGTSGPARNKKGKQRAHAFEGDEVLGGGKPAVCPTRESVDILLLSLETLDLILPLPHLPASLHSIACRILVSITLNLPSLPPSTISSDPSVYTELHRALLRVSRGLLLGPTNSHVGRSLAFVISALENGASDHSTQLVIQELQSSMDILVHPRLPAPPRPQPKPESIMLFRNDETKEEREAREDIFGSRLTAPTDDAPTMEVDRPPTPMHSIPLIPPNKGPSIQEPREAPQPSLARIQPTPVKLFGMGPSFATGFSKPPGHSAPAGLTIPPSTSNAPPLESPGLPLPSTPFIRTAPAPAPAPAPEAPASGSPTSAPAVPSVWRGSADYKSDEEMPEIDIESDSE